MLKTKLLMIAILVGFSSRAYAEDNITNRELRPNNISAGLDFSVASFSPFGGVPFLGVEYNHNLDKNYSIGLNVKTLLILNYINASGRYYFDLIKSKSSAIYVQADAGYGIAFPPIAPGGAKSYNINYVNFNPTVGYEFRGENGFTFNADIGPYLTYSFGIEQNTPGKFAVLPVKLGTKFGYSF